MSLGINNLSVLIDPLKADLGWKRRFDQGPGVKFAELGYNN